MSRAVYRPGPPLDRLIDFFWVSAACPAQTARERVLPSGGQALVIPLDERPLEVFVDDRTAVSTRFDDGVMCGARNTPLIIGSALGPTVGVRFKPGGARLFFDVPACELMNRVIPLEALCGASARSLRERLAKESAPHRRARVLEEFLIARVQGSLALPPALCASLYAFEDRRLASVAEVNRQTACRRSAC